MEADHQHCFGAFHLHFMYRPVRASHHIDRTTNQEIGIRKVLGAAVSRIVILISKQFVILIAIAFVIAVPAGYYAIHKWLQDFAYRISIGWWMFALAGALVIIIALITLSYQAIKAAIANPVKSLRTE